MAIQGRDGENQTLGRKADDPVTDPDRTGSVVALLKGMLRSGDTAQDQFQAAILRELVMIRIGIGIVAQADLEALLEGLE